MTAPPLPRNYLPRPDALEALRNTLLTEDPGPSIALTALKGMGGIGKTVLAQALCHDEAIQQAFPDGIVWITAGRESASDLVTRLREVGKGLKDDLSGYDTEPGSKNRYRTILRDKAALIVVDDVWNARDIEPFLADSPRSRLLFTTRDGAIASGVGAEQVMAGLLTPEQSGQLLGKWARVKPQDLPEQAADLIRESGRLPLALSLIGAMLRAKPRAYWTHVLNLLRNADLGRIRAQFPGYLHTDLLRAIQVSVEVLDEKSRVRYLALAVLLEDMQISPPIQQALWNGDEFDCLETAEQLVSLSLAQRDEETDGIRLHDLQLDYIRAQWADRESLDLIRGAVRLSSNVLARDPWQFISQMTGRLLPHTDNAAIRRFTSDLEQAATRPWLRALQPTLHPPGTALLRTLEGHSSSVTGVAVSPDGRCAISASRDKTLKTWDLETGRTLRTLEGHSELVSSVAVSPDGRRVISASLDQTVKVWDLQTGKALRTLKGHAHSVNGVAVSPDGRLVISASSDETLKVWNLGLGRPLQTPEGHSDWVSAVAVAPNGRTVSASRDYTLKVWDLETGQALHTLKGHTSSVYGVAVSPDGQRAVSASQDNTLKVWNLETGEALRTLAGHSDAVNDVVVSPASQSVVSASRDHTLKIWDWETGELLRTLSGHSDSVNGVALSADGQCAVSASSDESVRVWNLEAGLVESTLKAHSDAVTGVAVTPDGRRAVSASEDCTLKVWNLETEEALESLEVSFHVFGVAVSPDGRRAVSVSSDRTLKVWDLETGEVLATLTADALMFCCAFADAQTILAGDAGGHVHFLRLEGGS